MHEISCVRQFRKIGVVGLGYVGLPLAMLAGIKGCDVLGIDLNKQKVATLLSGSSYISDVPDQELQALLSAGNILIQSDYSELSDCDVIVICVPTPLTEWKKPDYSSLIGAVKGIAAVLRQGQLVILESTVAPGITETTVLPLLEAGGQIGGKDFFLAYSPERIDPGNKSSGLHNTAKLAAGLTERCLYYAQQMYQSLGIEVIPVRALAIAEMAKLLENTYRDINIAFINELAQVCHACNINIWEVIDAAASKPFGFQAFYPGPGVGGHCIPVDSVYYSSWARANGYPAKLAEHARLVNAAMPKYLADRISELLQSVGKVLSGSNVLVLGVTYKQNIADLRESPSVELIKELCRRGCNVCFHDPYVSEISLNSAQIERVALDEHVVLRQDCLVLAVAHSAYNFAWLSEVSTLIFDLTNGMARFPQEKIKKL
ncbi:MAG: nucleotide sugar dehydrogenase [Dethiobacter sp.]|nr:nucleotide sugar dehydrogenase [Dethiobacter sp.]MBS3901748.1 nucleotide sugar dehydrogenase [Dethiobacter sp.]MBS3989570.1 nucleotide sugar dehydrogenase [Dethiobacter sp.]